MVDASDKERVREASDIVQIVSETVELKQRGRELWGCCPFHDEKTPSFHVSPETGLWHCFGCGEGGDVFAYIEKREGMSFVEALRYLADKAGIELHFAEQTHSGPRRRDLLGALQAAERFYAEQLMRNPGAYVQQAREYLAARGMGLEVAKKWQLGYAPGNSSLSTALRQAGFSKEVLLAADLSVERQGRLRDRFYERVMFPIHDEQGQTIGFGGRVMGDAKPKYINTKDTQVWHKSKNLFGLDLAKAEIQAQKTVIVCEGYTDTIALHVAGFSYAVAVLGTALTLDHIQLLSRYKPERIIMLLDGDAAGQRAQEKAVRFIDKTSAALLSVTLPNNMDPQEFLTTHTKEEMQALLDGALPLIDEVLSRKLFSVNLQNPGQKVAALQEISRILVPLAGSVVLDGYAVKVADYLDMTKQAVRASITQAKPLEAEQSEQQPKPTSQPLQTNKRSPQAEIERSIAYILVNHPTLAAQAAERLQCLVYENDEYQAIVWALLALDANATPKDAVSAARASVENVDNILAKPPQGYSADLAESLLMRLLINHELLDAEARLRVLRAKVMQAGGVDDSKTLMQNIAKEQKKVVKLQQELDKSQVI